MAKASKKSTDKDAGASKPAATAKKPAAGAKGKPAGAGGAKKAQAKPASEAPLIDTNLAASAAAAMILNRAATGASGGTGGGQTGPSTAAQGEQKKESSAFKNLKDSLNKPAGSGLGGILGSTGQQKKSNLPFGGGKQVGRNQTFGADVNRSGVPRRTGGG